MTEALLTGLLAGYGIAMPVGAVSVLIVTLPAQVSLRHGLAAALGVATADGLYALVAVVGGAAFAAVIASVTRPLRLTAAAVLVLLALRGLVTAVRAHQAAAPTTAVSAVFVAAEFAASASWQLLLASGGALFGRLLTGARGRLAMAVLGNSVILLLAVRLGWTAMAS
ncbi:LysE family transporter [Streptomyces sp. Ac-502]|uniref:LysE family transporter n=1 Tax=Streptomyces sp. Ac-502 TaxID=3342801 RepID=UPI003862693A